MKNYMMTGEPGSCDDKNSALDTDDTILPLGQWVTMPRRPRRVAGKRVLEPFADAEPSENHDMVEEVTGVTMLHQVTGKKNANCSMLKPTTQENSMLREAVHIMTNENEPRCL